jgi:hypothetical protein
MACYQVSARFAFIRHKAALGSTHIKMHHDARPFLVRSGLPFGSGLKFRRFFRTKKEAAQFVSYLRAVYKNREPAPSPAGAKVPRCIVPNPAPSGGQLTLF